MNVNYELTGINNFHNADAISLRITGKKEQGFDGEVYIISKGQARRLEKHFCGVTGCGCAKGAIEELNAEGTAFGIPVRFCK